MGELRRREAAELIVGYSFDLQTNELIPKKVPNPGAGREHVFRAWRLKGSVADHVSMRAIQPETILSMPMTMPRTNSMHLIETDAFPFEFISHLAERESWRKEVHRPIYHVHKWWAKRLGSVFRGILLGSMLPEDSRSFHQLLSRRLLTADTTVFDPFMGSGTTIGEAHKLGFTAIGRDINPVAVESVRTALGTMDQSQLESSLRGIVARRRQANPDALPIQRFKRPAMRRALFLLGHAGTMPRVPEIRRSVPVLDHRQKRLPQPQAGNPNPLPVLRRHFPGLTRPGHGNLPHLPHRIQPRAWPGQRGQGHLPALPPPIFDPGRHRRDQVHARRSGFTASSCSPAMAQGISAGDRRRPGRLPEVLGRSYSDDAERRAHSLPTLALQHGYNTRQAMSYGFTAWRDFFNDRQLLALGWLACRNFPTCRRTGTGSALLTLFSGVLEFNNMFASYKGEGTGAVRHMFSHHILKPERTPIEANPWGTPKSSGCLFQPVPQPPVTGGRVPSGSHRGQWQRNRQRQGLCPAFQRRNRAALAE